MSGDKVEVDANLFNDARYLDVYYGKVEAISNAKTTRGVLSATTATDFLSSGIPQVISGQIDSEDVRENVTWSDALFPTNLYLWFEYQGATTVDIYVRMLVVLGVSYSHRVDYLQHHQKLLAVIDNKHPSTWADEYVVQNALLQSQLEAASYDPDPSSDGSTESDIESYKVYEGQRITLYLLELPT